MLDTLRHKGLIDFAKLLAEPVPPISWAVEGLIAEQDIAFFSGQGGVGKSYVTIALGLSLATGKPLFGRFPIKRQYRVAYMDLEMSEQAIMRRWARMLKGFELGADDMVALEHNLHVPLRPTAFQLDTSEGLRAIDAALKEHPVDFFIVDSYRRVYAGDANDSQVSNLIFRAMSGLRSAYGVGFIFIAHWRKRKGESALDQPSERLSGIADQRNMIDCHVAIDMPAPDVMRFTPDKGRHGEAVADQFRVLFSHDSEDDDSPFQLVHRPDVPEKAVKILSLVNDTDGPISYESVANKFSMPPRTLQRLVQRLAADRLIVRRRIGTQWHLEKQNGTPIQQNQKTDTAT